MLHEKTVAGTTLERLTASIHDPERANFSLAGGTAPALYVEHRKRIIAYNDLQISTNSIGRCRQYGLWLHKKVLLGKDQGTRALR